MKIPFESLERKELQIDRRIFEELKIRRRFNELPEVTQIIPTIFGVFSDAYHNVRLNIVMHILLS